MKLNKQTISHYTVRIRYKIISNLIKYLTPDLYFQISSLALSGKITPHVCNLVSQTPRPSIKMMRKHFGNQPVSGAEIGVQKGNNSISILKELNITKLYLIDIWEEYEKQEKEYENLKNYAMVLKRFKKNKRVEIIRVFSVEGSQKIENCSLDFVYIDANHDYEYVYNDIDCWYKKIRKGGVLAGHDVFSCNDVLDAVKDWCSNHNYRFHVVAPDWYFIKKGLTCGNCGYYNNNILRCEHEAISLNPNSKICVCFMPIISYEERMKEVD